VADLKGFLGYLLRIEGTVAAVVVSRDGFVIEAATRGGPVDTEAIGAIISTGIVSCETIGRELQIGELTQGMIEYTGGVVMMSPAGKDAILAVTADQKTNLGHIRYQLKKIAPEVMKAL